MVLGARAFVVLVFAQNSAATQESIPQMLERQFERYDSDYIKKRDAMWKRSVELEQELTSFQQKGFNMECSTQIYLDIRWAVNPLFVVCFFNLLSLSNETQLIAGPKTIRSILRQISLLWRRGYRR